MPARASVERARGRAPRGDRGRATSSSSGRRTPAHGDFATNVALRTAKTRRRSAARACRRARRADDGARRRSPRPRSPGPGSSTSGSPTAFFVEALGEIGDGLRRRVGRVARAGPGRAGVGQPDRARSPSRRRGTAPTATRWRGCSRSRGHARRARVLLQRRGRADGALPRFGRRAPARRGPSRGRLSRRLHRRPRRRARATRCRACSSAIEETMERFRVHFDCWARQSELEQRLPELLPRLDTYEKDGALWARSSAYGDERRLRARALGRAGRDADVPRRRRRRTSSTSSTAASTARSTCSAPTITATAQVVRGDRAHARLRPGPRRGAALPVRASDAGRRADEDVEAARRRRLPRRLHRRGRRRRGALVPRQPRPRPDDRDRPRPGGREDRNKNPVFYVQYAHARIAAILRNAEAAAVGGAAAGAARARGEGADQAADRLPGDRARGGRAPRPAAPAGVRDPARGRLPPLLPRVPRARRPGRRRSGCGLCRATQR